MLRLTRKMLDHRMTHADSTLSSYSTSDEGLVRAVASTDGCNTLVFNMRWSVLNEVSSQDLLFG
jgi:hypothetical protein